MLIGIFDFKILKYGVVFKNILMFMVLYILFISFGVLGILKC